jgi:hypothetical protein
VDGNAMLASLGYGKLSINYILAEIVGPEQLEEKLKETAIDRLLRPLKGRKPRGIKIHGIDDVLFQMAKCCNPVPGEAVVGFVTRGRGITVHVADCPNVLSSDEERKVDVEWDLAGRGPHRADPVPSSCRNARLLAESPTAWRRWRSTSARSAPPPGRSFGATIFVLNIVDVQQLTRILAEIRLPLGLNHPLPPKNRNSTLATPLKKVFSTGIRSTATSTDRATPNKHPFVHRVKVRATRDAHRGVKVAANASRPEWRRRVVGSPSASEA